MKKKQSSAFYDEATTFLLNGDIREDIDLLRKHFRISSLGELIRHLIRSAKSKLNQPTP